MPAGHFRIGDRVRAQGGGFVPAGTPGTIQLVLHAAFGEYYYVQFGGFEQRHLMHRRDLERADTAPRTLRLDDALLSMALVMPLAAVW